LISISAADHLPRLIFKIDVGERLPGMIAHNEASGLFLDYPSQAAALEDPLPTPEELDELGPDEAIRRIESVVENNTQLCFAVDGDTRSWGEMAEARVKARAKAKTKCSLFNWIGPGEAARLSND
jgi:hypothetical protein